MFEIKALVPAMTSVNTPEGECILYATGGNPTGDAPFYRVFDGNPSTIGGWANNDVNGTGTKDAYIGYHFTKPVKCSYAEFRWGGSNNSNYIFGVKLQGSNDGINWTDLSEVIDIPMKTDPTIIESIEPDLYFTYLCIRYVSYSTPTNIGYPQAHEIQFYGLEKYNDFGYLGLFWFDEGEDVKIFDVETGTELTEHTLDKRSDEIEIIIEEVQNE